MTLRLATLALVLTVCDGSTRSKSPPSAEPATPAERARPRPEAPSKPEPPTEESRPKVGAEPDGDSGTLRFDETDAERRARADMVAEQIEPRDVDDPPVLRAMGRVPRHLFVPPELRHVAYRDGPLPIGHDVTISQPYIVALMTQLAEVDPGDRVLDVGTGSGYQAAVLAEMGARVFGIEIIEPLAERAAKRLAQLGYDQVVVRHGDGYRGWPEHAPFDAIILAAAPHRIPTPLKEQLKVGGRLVLPVGGSFAQNLVVVTRTAQGFTQRTVTPVRFVPMTGEVQRR